MGKEIRTFTPFDDTDSPSQWPDSPLWDGREFSACNQSVLESYLKENYRSILEIGVSRLTTNKADQTSTSVFLSKKHPDCIYIGVDIEDKSHVKGQNVFTLKADSGNIEQVMEFARSKGVQGFDLIFIDGWHSINQVLKEWEYSNFLNEGGVIGFHDTNYHPGPKALLNSLEGWEVSWHCDHDWGIAFVTKHKKDENNQPPGKPKRAKRTKGELG